MFPTRCFAHVATRHYVRVLLVGVHRNGSLGDPIGDAPYVSVLVIA